MKWLWKSAATDNCKMTELLLCTSTTAADEDRGQSTCDSTIGRLTIYQSHYEYYSQDSKLVLSCYLSPYLLVTGLLGRTCLSA